MYVCVLQFQFQFDKINHVYDINIELRILYRPYVINSECEMYMVRHWHNNCYTSLTIMCKKVSVLMWFGMNMMVWDVIMFVRFDFFSAYV